MAAGHWMLSFWEERPATGSTWGDAWGYSQKKVCPQPLWSEFSLELSLAPRLIDKIMKSSHSSESQWNSLHHVWNVWTLPRFNMPKACAGAMTLMFLLLSWKQDYICWFFVEIHLNMVVWLYLVVFLEPWRFENLVEIDHLAGGGSSSESMTSESTNVNCHPWLAENFCPSVRITEELFIFRIMSSSTYPL